MLTAPRMCGIPRATPIVLVFVVGFMTLLLMYQKASPSITCPPLPQMPAHPLSTHPPPTHPLPTSAQKTTDSPANELSKKPILLLWFWPLNYRFDLGDCKTLFNIDGCRITDDRSLYQEADALLISQRDIKNDLSNLPPSPRPLFQKWIWLHLESPTNTQKMPGIENLFNETLNYRKDADIPVRWRLTKKKKDEYFVSPKKERLVCWIMSNNDPKTGTTVRYEYYKELAKHIKVDVFGKAFGRFLNYDDYFPMIASCKFYLSFENSIHKDYITEKLNGPLAVGTVPIVLGPSRQNYEDFVPGDSFIHVNDFPDAKALADFLLKLDKDDVAYMRYFNWRKHFSARRHLIKQNQEFTQAICYGCEHVGRHREYRVAHNIYKWYFDE